MLLNRPMIGVLAVTIAAVTIPASLTTAAEDGFKPIFDGKTLEGWDGDPRFWRVEDGAIVGQTTKDNPTGHNTFLIWRGEPTAPGDFELKVEFKLDNHNSGIQYRSFEIDAEKWRMGGYQADIAGEKYMGIVYGEGWRGIMVQRGQRVHFTADGKKKVEQIGDPAKLVEAVDINGWNEYHIIAQGPKMVQKINGQTMAELIDENSKARREGLIAFQLHAGPPMTVHFRNIRLKTDE